LGKNIEAGNNLLIDEIHDPKQVIPLRMAPMILLGTLVSHLFGGSVGREGTAVQMGGSLADQLTHLFHLQAEDRRILIMAGISAGFASIFGTPLAGALFGLEVLAVGRLRYDAIFPCFLAALIGNFVTLKWGIHHTLFVIPHIPAIGPLGLASAAIAGIIFGVVGMLFAKAVHATSHFFKKTIAYGPARPFWGGVVIALAMWVFGTRYAGLGISTMVDAFGSEIKPWDCVGKFIFTVATLGSGFKGGEVTPLFYIGATLGHTLSAWLPLPAPFLAGLGFVGVFAGAANVPLASILVAVELFGAPVGVYAAVVCVLSYLFSGHAGI
jgi:H+/Cl- antiporter ClcA